MGAGTLDAILITGPTASGKSGLAIALAARLGGTVVNADSMQVYADLRIITARPSSAEEMMVPHALFGTVDGATNFSVIRWLAAVTDVIAVVREGGHLPILVGGTGLYFKALTQGLSDLPDVPDAVRASVRERARDRSTPELHAELAAADPATAERLRPTDTQRVLRALEVHAATGESLSQLQGRRGAPVLDVTRCAAIVLAPDRATLRQRIDERFDAMMAAGALAEVEALAHRRLDPALPVMRAHGVPPLLRHLGGEIARDEAVAVAKADTRRYIKRQETFARHQLARFVPAAPETAEATVLAITGAR